MRFCDLFISYKIELKSIKSTIPFTKLPLYRKVFIIILLVGATFSGILCLIKQTWASYIPITLICRHKKIILLSNPLLSFHLLALSYSPHKHLSINIKQIMICNINFLIFFSSFIPHIH